MKVGFFQFAPQFGETQRNLESLLQAIDTFQGHLLVFPELALSGYQFLSTEEAWDLAEDIPSGMVCQRLTQAIRGRSLYVVVGLAERDRNGLYNSAVLIGPKGYIGTYRKMHLFFEETLWFSPGNTGFPVWDIGMAKIGLLVCFDWFYPEAARTLALKGADILCHPSNLVLPYTLADKLFGSNLHERFDNARMGAVVEHTLEKKPLNLRLVWQQLRSGNS